jgi:hypothetical protein
MLEAQKPEPLQQQAAPHALEYFWHSAAGASAPAAVGSSGGAGPAGAGGKDAHGTAAAAVIQVGWVGGGGGGDGFALLHKPSIQACLPCCAPTLQSRYKSDFMELNRLGRGGFGLVVAATNRQVAMSRAQA